MIVFWAPYAGVEDVLRPVYDRLVSRPGQPATWHASPDKPVVTKDRVVVTCSRYHLALLGEDVRTVLIDHGVVIGGKVAGHEFAKRPDLEVVSSVFCQQKNAHYYGYPKVKTVVAGFPQTDFVVNGKDNEREILYYSSADGSQRCQRLLTQMVSEPPAPYRVRWKMHQFYEFESECRGLQNRLSSWNDALAECGTLVTDVSSVISLFLARPQRRIFVYDNWQVAGSVTVKNEWWWRMRSEVAYSFSSFNELKDLLWITRENDWKLENRSVWSDTLFGSTKDGNASERIAQRIEEYANK